MRVSSAAAATKNTLQYLKSKLSLQEAGTEAKESPGTKPRDSVANYQIRLLYDVQPVSKKELDTTDQKADTTHDGEAEGGSKTDHDNPDTYF